MAPASPSWAAQRVSSRTLPSRSATKACAPSPLRVVSAARLLLFAPHSVADVRKPEVCGMGLLGVFCAHVCAQDAQRVIASVVAQFGRLDVLVNNAAGNFLCLAEDLSTNAFRTVVDIDLVGTFCMSTSAREALQRTRGCIINISATLHFGATQVSSCGGERSSSCSPLPRDHRSTSCTPRPPKRVWMQ